jgi:hypothetical protein
MTDEATPVRIDHLAYLEDARYRREIRMQIMAAGEMAGDPIPVHAPDRSCCRRESWMRTVFGLGHALRADGYPFDITSIDALKG